MTANVAGSRLYSLALDKFSAKDLLIGENERFYKKPHNKYKLRIINDWRRVDNDFNMDITPGC